MGIVEEVGSEVDRAQAGRPGGGAVQHLLRQLLDVPRELYAQCETTQVTRARARVRALFGYTSLYGSVPGGQAEYLRVPQAQFGPIKVPHDRRRRAVPLPVRHPAHRLAGVEVRRRPAGRHPGRLRARARSGSSRPDRPPPRRRPGDRAGSGARAPGVGRRARHRGARRRERRRRAGRAHRPGRRPRPGRGDRRRRHGGARLAGRQAGPRPPSGCCRTSWPSR